MTLRNTPASGMQKISTTTATELSLRVVPWYSPGHQRHTRQRQQLELRVQEQQRKSLQRQKQKQQQEKPRDVDDVESKNTLEIRIIVEQSSPSKEDKPTTAISTAATPPPTSTEDHNTMNQFMEKNSTKIGPADEKEEEKENEDMHEEGKEVEFLEEKNGQDDDKEEEEEEEGGEVLKATLPMMGLVEARPTTSGYDEEDMDEDGKEMELVIKDTEDNRNPSDHNISKLNFLLNVAPFETEVELEAIIDVEEPNGDSKEKDNDNNDDGDDAKPIEGQVSQENDGVEGEQEHEEGKEVPITSCLLFQVEPQEDEERMEKKDTPLFPPFMAKQEQPTDRQIALLDNDDDEEETEDDTTYEYQELVVETKNDLVFFPPPHPRGSERYLYNHRGKAKSRNRTPKPTTVTSSLFGASYFFSSSLTWNFVHGVC